MIFDAKHAISSGLIKPLSITQIVDVMLLAQLF